MTDDHPRPDPVVRVSAPAKLTWFLEVVGRRDDGYHQLRSEMVSLNLCDDLAIDESRTDAVTMATDEGEGAPPLLDPAENLVARALMFVGRRAAVHVHKRIPVGGGLGGGSSDAGAILWWAGVHDVSGAVVLGGDVPFCVRGGRALVEGVGERVTALDFEERTVTLFVPPFAVATAACYRAFDELSDAGNSPKGRNHLTAAACQVQPDLATALEWTAAELSCAVTLCGSGSTFFVEGAVAGLSPPSTLRSPVGDLQVKQLTTVRPRESRV